jgi:1-acyl-sn-glycerol-3-phosphate acyltransferase
MSKTLEQKMCSRSLGYAFVRNFLVRPALYLYYRKLDVTGAKTVPNTWPVIFTPNHQNALMDALLILCTKNRQPVFVARADIFQKPLIIAVLHFLRILPIYRKRDGGNSSDNNQETFDVIPKVLQSGYSVGIMPEGIHNKFKRLQMLQKGVFRLAMLAQEKFGNSPMIKIVPVGIEYTSTNKFRSDVMVRYGEAIELSDFYDLYAENPARAFKKMQDVLMEKMREGMIDIASDQCYTEIERLRVLYQHTATKRLGLKYRKADHRLQAQQKTIAALQKYEQTNPDEMSALCLAVRDYFDILQQQDMNDWVIKSQPYSLVSLMGRCLMTIVGFPLWILGVLFNYLPYKLSTLASRRVKDPQFISSVQFVAGLVLFPLTHFILAVLMVIFIPCIWGKIIMPFLLIPLGVFSWMYVLFNKNLGALFRAWFGRKSENPEILQAINLRKDIFEKMGKIEL